MWRPLSAFVLLAACASPAPEFFGAARRDVRLSGIDFAVWHDGSRAEVVRLTPLARARRLAVPPLMIQAVEAATGCRVRPGSVRTGMPGDTGEARMALDC
ncbi:MAG: hypothetical protein N2422_10170 [Rhodobacteraceae bacterium]|nr:hypothetical protein [Paracoccaceae bacterium]